MDRCTRTVYWVHHVVLNDFSAKMTDDWFD
jgi:hypothetical protein